MKTALALLALAAAGAASASDSPWRPGEPLAEPRAGLEAVSIDKTIYVVGGSGLVAPSKNFEAYVPELGIWDSRTSLPNGRARFGVAALNGRVVVAGGERELSPVGRGRDAWDGGATKKPDGKFEQIQKETTASVISYDAEKDAWIDLPALPSPRKGLTLTELGGALYVIGGGVAAVDVYDANVRVWLRRDAPAELARGDAAAAAFDGKIWFVGGRAVDDAASARVDVYDPASNAWTRGPDLPKARVGAAAVVYDGALHVLGGANADGGDVGDEHWVLDAAAGVWTIAAPMPAPRADFAAVAVGGSLVVIGGGGGGGFFGPFTTVDAVDVFEAESRR